MKCLFDLDLFGKEPDLYYNGKSQKNTFIGLFFTIVQSLLVCFFLIFKLIRMIARKDFEFYDTYAYEEIPSINITNESFYGAFSVGGFIDETIYYIKAQYVSGVKKGDIWDNTYKDLEIETCSIEKFGKEHRELFKNEPLNKYYCLKNADLKLEGYSYLESFAYINLKVFPCVNQTKDGRACKDYNTIYNFFKENFIEFKMQDYLLTPDNYKSPVKPSKKDITCPIFLKIYQRTYSYIQIVRVETNEDIIGLSLIPKNKVEVFTKYQDSFVIATPGTDEILKTGGPACDVTLQLAANVLTQKRYYKTLINAMEEVGGLMEFFYELFRIILSFIVNKFYEISLVKNIFSFDEEKAKINIKILKDKNNKKDYGIKNDKKKSVLPDDKINFNKYNSVIDNTTKKEDLAITGNKSFSKSYNMEITNINLILGENNKTEKYKKRENFINKICLFIRNKKRNAKINFIEEGMKIITEKLDISNLFINLYIVEKIKDKFTIDSSISISKKNETHISTSEKNNIIDNITIDSSIPILKKNEAYISTLEKNIKKIHK